MDTVVKLAFSLLTVFQFYLVEGQVLPPSPRRPTIVSTTPQSTSITITWSQPEEDVVDNFTITYSYQGPCPNAISAFNMTTNDSTIREYTLVGLEEFSHYTINITALNRAGRSIADSTTVKTLFAAPSGEPQSLRVTSATVSNITIQWGPVDCLDRNGDITGYRVRYGLTSSGVRITRLTDVNTRIFTATALVPRKSYTFQVEVFNSDLMAGPLNTIEVETTMPEHVGIFLNGVLYDNNSIVTLDEIGEDSAALFCLTNKTDCCTTPYSSEPVGEWFFPNASSINDHQELSDSIYRTRGPSVVVLHRRNNAQTTGVFRCQIEDASGVNQQLYVGVYPVNFGSPSITGLLYNRSTLTLTCTSTGGPATTVTWRKNGEIVETNDPNFQMLQFVVNGEMGNYESFLSSNDSSNFVSTFSCSVSNSRGNSFQNIVLNGVFIRSDLLIAGMSASLTCISDTPASMIEWLDSERRVVSMVTSMDNHDLAFNPVNDSIHNSVYTCRVTRDGTIAEQNITLHVTVSPSSVVTVVNDIGSAIAGQNYSLNCTVTKTVSGLMNTPTATWTGYGPDSDVQVTATSAYESVLTFHPLKTSHASAGYTCTGHLTSPVLNNPLEISINKEVTVKIAIPNVTISVPSGPLYAGTTSVTLTCTITLSDDVNTDVMMEVTWLRSVTPLSNTSSRVTISPLAESGNTFTSNLTLSPLSLEDTNLTCEVVALSPRIGLVTRSDTGSDAVFVSVRVPPLVLSVTGGTRPIATTGSGCNRVNSLVCRATVINNVAVSPNITWLDPWNNSIQFLSNHSDIHLEEPGELVFNNVTQQNIGDYTCHACASIEEVGINNLCNTSVFTVSNIDPLPVEELECSSVSPFELQVTWRESYTMSSSSDLVLYLTRGSSVSRNGVDAQYA